MSLCSIAATKHLPCLLDNIAPLHHGSLMRLTINLDDDLYAMVRSHAVASKTSISEAVCDLMRGNGSSGPSTPFSPPSGLAAGSFNGLHTKSKFLAASHKKQIPSSKMGQLDRVKVFARNHRYKLYQSGEFYDIENDVLEKSPLAKQDLTDKQVEIQKLLSAVITRYAALRQN